MEKKRKVALTDWDGTIRPGFTLDSWVKYLSKEMDMNHTHVKKIEELLRTYYENQLSHDLLASRTAAVYAEFLKGRSKTEILTLAEKFVKHDIHKLFEYSIPLFKYLISKSIGIIVISGAPFEVLEQYRKLLNLYKVYGLEIETNENGHYTGKIKHNYGLYQQKAIIRSKLDREYSVIIGLGNSYSDIPILRNVRLAIIVDNQSLNIEGKNVYIEGHKTKGNELLNIIEKEVKL